jgi:hypothetical protein
MNMRKHVLSIALLILSASALGPAQAEDNHQNPPASQNLPASIEKRLASFDPEAVAAARHYYTSPLLKASFTAMMPKITEAMTVAMERANPGLDSEKKRAAMVAAQEAVAGRLDLIIDLSMISALEVFSKEELIAVDQFYASPVGQSVLTKMPKVMERLPAMMQVVMPLMIDDLRAKIKAKGLDVQL